MTDQPNQEPSVDVTEEQTQTSPTVNPGASFFSSEDEAREALRALEWRKELERVKSQAPAQKPQEQRPVFERPADWDELHPDEKIAHMESAFRRMEETFEQKLQRGAQELAGQFTQQIAPVMNKAVHSEAADGLPEEAKSHLNAVIQEMSAAHGTIAPTQENIRILRGLALERAYSDQARRQQIQGEPARSYEGIPRDYHAGLAKLEADLKASGADMTLWTKERKLAYIKEMSNA